MAGRLEGKIAVVTAAGQGIGRAIAEAFIAEGALVIATDIDAKKFKWMKSGYPMKLDVRKPREINALVKATKTMFGEPDILINVAGVVHHGTVLDATDAEWDFAFDLNVRSMHRMIQAFLPGMLKKGGGSIVNMSSAAGRHGYAFRTPYSSAKFGVVGFTQSLAKELGPHRIRVNAILPGVVEGARIDKVIADRARQIGISHEEMEKRYLERVSLRRMVSPYDVASMVAFLLSDAGINVSGQSLGVDGNVETL
jgi:NAD(P)-dependent dehydrogenase (short-subunit alcohol dehydrogenase family)